MTMCKSLLLAAVLALHAPQDAPLAPGYVHYDFSWPALKASHWSISLDPTGNGRYEDLSGAEQGPAGPVRPVHISEATRARINAAYPAVSAGKCETKEKNIAQTGRKLIAFSKAQGETGSECSFNYSDDEKLNDASATFQAIALTVQTGDRLKHKHRFDHLGLDAELDSLLELVKGGRAIEVQNIAPILQSIVDDEEMMSPSRRKAKSVLALSEASATPHGADANQPASSAR